MQIKQIGLFFALCLLASTVLAEPEVAKETATNAAPADDTEELLEDPNELIDILPSEIITENHFKDMIAQDFEDDEEQEEGGAPEINLLEDEVDTEKAVKTSTAYAVGDPHFRQFDGGIHHFQGVGQFKLSECGRTKLQARNFVCGKHKHYGVVACWREAAIKHKGKNGDTSVVEVTTRGSQVIKLNGKTVPQNKPFTTPSGCHVTPTTYTVSYFVKAAKKAVSHRIRMVKIRCDGNMYYITSYAIFHVRQACKACRTPGSGLFGNNNCNPNDDWVSYNGKVNYAKYLKSVASRIDNSPKKKIHEWGMSYMVRKSTGIENIFGDAAAKYNKPELVPGKIKFRDAKFKAIAHQFCKKNALTPEFYFDCMEDCAATGKINMAKTDTGALEMYDGFKKHANHHSGKTALVKTLNKMLVDFHSQKMLVNDKIKADKQRVQRGHDFYVSRREQRGVSCAMVPRERAILAHVAKKHALEEGKRKMAVKSWSTNYPKWIKNLAQIASERELIKQMLRVLERLVSVKSLDELEIDYKSLEARPELKATFTNLLQRAHKGHTDVVKKLLLELLWKLSQEEKNIKTNINVARKARNAQTGKAGHWKAQKRNAENRLANAKRDCNAKKAAEGRALATYRELLTAVARANREAAQILVELREEIAMANSLKDAVMDWSKNKKGFKKCKRDEETLEIDEAMTEADAEKIDAEFPVEHESKDEETPAETAEEAQGAEEAATADIEEEETETAPMDEDESVVKALEEDTDEDEE